MVQVAIAGAGEIGGLVAHVLARKAIAKAICLLDVDSADGRTAEGKALDIMQAAPVEGFAVQLTGSADLTRAATASIVVIADSASGEWPLETALMRMKRLHELNRQAFVVCAGATHLDLVERGARELNMPRLRLLGSAPEAVAGGARAMVTLETAGSPRDVALSVLGVPPDHVVIPWEDATAGGFRLDRLLDGPARRRIESRVAALWPPGPYALASAACKVIAALVGRSRQLVSCFVAPDDAAGVRSRAAAMPVRLGPGGSLDIVFPTLTGREQVLFENATML